MTTEIRYGNMICKSTNYRRTRQIIGPNTFCAGLEEERRRSGGNEGERSLAPQAAHQIGHGQARHKQETLGEGNHLADHPDIVIRFSQKSKVIFLSVLLGIMAVFAIVLLIENSRLKE